LGRKTSNQPVEVVVLLQDLWHMEVLSKLKALVLGPRVVVHPEKPQPSVTTASSQGRVFNLFRLSEVETLKVALT